TRNGGMGVAVLMRYTLRLLTAQQFQRASALVCAAQGLRRRGEKRGGRGPVRVGVWGGAGVSPHWYGGPEGPVRGAPRAGHGQHANVLQTLACPWCGAALRAERDADPREDLRRLLLWCPNAEGDHACPFSRTHSHDGLPILTVDEEIYRLAPSLVIATVD